MTPTPEAQDRIRRYLLGQLSDGAREEIEQDLLTNGELFEELLVVEDELIDEYLGGKLSPDDRASFERYFLATSERHDKLRFGKAFDKYLSTQAAISSVRKPTRTQLSFTPGVFSSPLRMAAYAILLVGIALTVWSVFFRQSEVDKGLLALNSAYRERRPVEARISRFDYAPLPNTRGSEQVTVDDVSLNRAERILLDEVSEHPTPASHHALGCLYLAERKFDQAIAQFEEALKGDPNNARLHSDLGAAFLERGKTNRLSDKSGKGFEELAKSLEQLNKALDLDGSLLEALFNRALVHQEMVLPQQAEEDWRKYLEKDSNSKWAEEARRHLTNLQQRNQNTSQTKEVLLNDFLSAFEKRDSDRAWEIVRHSRDAFSVGKLIRDQLLDGYLEAEIEKGDADQRMPALEFLGELEAQRTGDRYTSELARFYRFSSPEKRAILSQARVLMKQGQESYARAKPLEALDFFNESKQLFGKVGDRWEGQYAELWTGYSNLSASNTQRSVAILRDLATSFEGRGYKWLSMRALHFLSGAEYNLGEYSRGIDHNHRALALAEEMGDSIGIFNTSSILTEQYRYIGNYEQSLACTERSLSIVESCALNEVQVSQHYGLVASALASSGLYSAAADYQREALRRVLTTAQLQNISLAYANLGLLYGKTGNYDQALKNAKLAYETARAHSDEHIRKEMMGYSSLIIGDLYKHSGDITKAIESYDECLALSETSDNYYGLYEAHKGRLSSYLMLKNDAAASEELQTTLALIEKYRTQIREGDNRNHFFDLEQSVYDLAIEFEYSRMNAPEKAFEYSEASRSRSLLDSANSNAKVADRGGQPDLVFTSMSQPLGLSDIQERMPGQGQIVQYAVLADKVLIWVITKTTFSYFERQVPQDQLTRTIFHYVRSISRESTSQNPEITKDARQLFEILIKPIEGSIDRTKPLYIIPDKALNYLPFNALISPDSNRFLVEDYVTVISPSSSLLITSTEAARKKEFIIRERLLGVGNPRFDRGEFPTLVSLPSAVREVEQVARFYDSSCVLKDEDATKSRVRMEMERSDIIHLAVHSVFDEHTPLRSKLLLAQPAAISGSDPSSGALEAQEIYRMKLSSVKIVVLSACQSAVERYYGGEGMINLARPFLAVGVPMVVASFWPVESDSTAELMIRFHKHRTQDHVPTASALRLAQLEMLHSSDDHLRQPYCWASFTGVGGWTSF